MICMMIYALCEGIVVYIGKLIWSSKWSYSRTIHHPNMGRTVIIPIFKCQQGVCEHKIYNITMDTFSFRAKGKPIRWYTIKIFLYIFLEYVWCSLLNKILNIFPISIAHPSIYLALTPLYEGGPIFNLGWTSFSLQFRGIYSVTGNSNSKAEQFIPSWEKATCVSGCICIYTELQKAI